MKRSDYSGPGTAEGQEYKFFYDRGGMLYI